MVLSDGEEGEILGVGNSHGTKMNTFGGSGHGSGLIGSAGGPLNGIMAGGNSRLPSNQVIHSILRSIVSSSVHELSFERIKSFGLRNLPPLRCDHCY
mmetsp:Transcript_31822/g.73175  ORF Transcript_31822/g.73175 Transcript_31822/m.73175 type:complete len:97 (-) Transcript_31822:6145-6435(-)